MGDGKVYMGQLDGNNWQPVSDNPDTGYLSLCGMPTSSGLQRAASTFTPEECGGVAEIGSIFSTGGFGAQKGYFGAWDPTTGKIVRRKKWPGSCYSGTTSTGGNLVFAGRNNGGLQAYDATDGTQKWSFPTGAGANSTVSSSEWEGKQYVAFYAGGNALAGTAHGANLWLFSLDGTVDPVAPDCGMGTVEHAGQEGAAPNATAGKAVFSANCAGCHGANGLGGNGGPTLNVAKNPAAVVKQVTNGSKPMPTVKGQLTTKQITDVGAYVAT